MQKKKKKEEEEEEKLEYGVFGDQRICDYKMKDIGLISDTTLGRFVGIHQVED